MVKRLAKSYFVFTSVVYRMAVLILLPLLTVGLFWLLRDLEVSMGVGLVIVIELVIMAEIFFDSWLFGGLQSKEAERLDYLKTSARGMGILKNALKLDLVRRLLTAAVIYGACYLIAGAFGNGLHIWMNYIYIILLSYTFSLLGVFITRFESGMWINMIVSYLAGILALVSWFLPGLTAYTWVYVLVYGVLAILMSVIALRVAFKKVEGSYYDK